MKIHYGEQGTPEWFALRLGKVTASHFKDVLNKKSGRDTYMKRLRAERRFLVREDTYTSQAMKTGTEREPDARDLYEWLSDNTVEQVCFVARDSDVGCSPDGLIGTDGLLEIKCPNLSTHNYYIDTKRLPPEYKAQVQGQLWVCERQWCDFVSYHPDAITFEEEDLRLFMLRIERDESYITLFAAAVAAFVVELQEMEGKTQ